MKVICVKGNIPRDGYTAVLTKGVIYQLHVRFVTNFTGYNYWFNDDDGNWKLYDGRYESFFMELDQYRNSCIDKVLEHD